MSRLKFKITGKPRIRQTPDKSERFARHLSLDVTYVSHEEDVDVDVENQYIAISAV
jgi:hypothetical protein